MCKVRIGNKADTTLVVTKGLREKLYVFEREQWDAFLKKWTEMPLTERNARAFFRFFMGMALEIETDSEGEMEIPEALWTYLTMGKKEPAVAVYSTEEFIRTEREKMSFLETTIMNYQPWVIMIE